MNNTTNNSKTNNTEIGNNINRSSQLNANNAQDTNLKSHSIYRRFLPGLLMLLLGVVILGAPVAANAQEQGIPYHEVRGVACEVQLIGGGNMVKAFPPRDVRPWGNRRDDVAHWRPVLYRWDGTQWVKWRRESTGWPAYAYVDIQGLNRGVNPGWRNNRSHGQLMWMPFLDLPRGSYTVLHQIKWETSGMWHNHWAPNSCATTG